MRLGEPGKMQAAINITPLVDVVLVLLIIFMVITPMIVRGVSVDLPITSHHDRKNDANKDLIVSINSSGDVYVNAERRNRHARSVTHLLGCPCRSKSTQVLRL